MAKEINGLTEAQLYAPDLDEGKLDVETYQLPSEDSVENPYLKRVWAQVRNLMEGDEDDQEPEPNGNGYQFKGVHPPSLPPSSFKASDNGDSSEDLIADILAALDEDALAEAVGEKALNGYATKAIGSARGKPCKQGQAASRTGCIPAKKPTGRAPAKPGKPLPKKPAAKPAVKVTAKDVFKEINTLRRGKPSAKQVNDLAKKLGTLTVTELNRIKGELKVKASGKKVELAKKIAKWAVKGDGKTPATTTRQSKLPSFSFPIPKIPKFNRIAEFFGKSLDDKTVAGIGNLVKGSKVQIYKDKTEDYGNVLHIASEDGVSSDRTFFRKKGKIIVHNDWFKIKDDSKYKGDGFKFFLSQVNALKKAGVSRIETHAAGNKGGTMNGYYTWPRLGYDGTIRPSQFDRLPEELKNKMGNSRSILKLFSLPGGKEEWKEKGSDIVDAFFDLSDNSPNMRALAAYVKEREAKK